MIIELPRKTVAEALEDMAKHARRLTLALQLEAAALLIVGAALRAERQARGRRARPFRRRKWHAIGGRR